MLNVDWFNPFKHTVYSVGVLYLTVMNLPRSKRYKQENVILVGLVPGPSEPPLNINSFLSPLVDELLKFWRGLHMKVANFSEPKLIRCALLCVACDIPASRKVSGFLGHAANRGCSKCMKSFPGPVGQKDYSGFDREKWAQRSEQLHRQSVAEILRTPLKSEKTKLEAKYGCRYSALLDLPYFDPVRMTIIDPLHNLFLGSAKHILKKVWIESNLIPKSKFSDIQTLVDRVTVPPHLGRIPSKIASSFSGFTADQFKNWTNIFSPLVLYDILPEEDYECWKHFILASRILCKSTISNHDIQLADALLLQFCRRVERMYGKNVITPNMHLHCHIKDNLYDYGPIHGFWLFPYERYNGILEHFPMSHRSIEVQLMHRFVREFELSAQVHELPNLFATDFGEVLGGLVQPTLQGSLKYTSSHANWCEPVDPRKVKDWRISPNSTLELPKTYTRGSFSQLHLDDLRELYAVLYPSAVHIDLHSMYRKYPNMVYNGVTYYSENSRIKSKSSIVLAIFHPNRSAMAQSDSIVLRPARIEYFVRHSVNLGNENCVYEHTLACISWLKEHHDRDYVGKPCEIWWKDLFDESSFNFLPIQLLSCHCAHTDIEFESQTVLLVCPIINVNM